MSSERNVSESPNPCTTIAEFKMPPDPSTLASIRKKKVKVLEEDEYVEKLGSIIERDFFPELDKLKAQTQYIEAAERSDTDTMRRLQERFSEKLNRLESPATFETPEAPRQNDFPTPVIHNKEEKLKPEDLVDAEQSSGKKSVSLDQFLSKHTSEDNESFNELQAEADKKFRIEKPWMFKDDEVKSLEWKNDQLVLPSIEDQAAAESSSKPDMWTYKNVNSVFYHPDGVEFSKEELIVRAKEQRKILFENTRFKTNPWKREIQDESLKKTAAHKQELNAYKVGIDGREHRADTPSMNGYKFVKTPSPMPGVEESPLMTWGEVDSTPYRLEGCETPLPISGALSGGPAFSIQDVPKRDRLAFELAEKNSRFYRDRKGKAIQKARSNIKTPNVGNLSVRVSTMSPAAQRLATAKLGIRLGTDKALKAAYTPSPRIRRKDMTPTPQASRISSSIRKRTNQTPTPSRTSEEDSLLTDNLLKLPSPSANKRSRASDYF